MIVRLNPVSPAGTPTILPCTLIGLLPVKLQANEASARFPFDGLASAEPPASTVSVPPLFEHVPAEPAYPTMPAWGQTKGMDAETKVFGL